jgi:RNA-binding protein
MDLSTKHRQYLKGLAHSLKPVVQVGGKGIVEGLIEQIREQLLVHELIKVRFNSESAVEPASVAQELAARTESQLVQKLGRVIVLYRRRQHKPSIQLPPAKRVSAQRS